MRVPPYIAIPACLLTVFLVWLFGTRGSDFLTPPSEAVLNEIREEALASIPASRMEDDAISIKVPSPKPELIMAKPPQAEPPLDLGELNAAPALDEYSERAPEGSDQLFVLAKALEEVGSMQRALLAYERMLDLSQSNPEQIQLAISAIQRLKTTLPLWNSDAKAAVPVEVHIGTGKKFAKVLPKILEGIAKELSEASSGLLHFTGDLHIGKSIQSDGGPTPVALWITGTGEDPTSTDVLSFTTDNPEKLRNDLLKTVFNLIRSHLSKSTSYTPAPESSDDPLSALDSHISRLLWNEFALHLSQESDR